jgi:hypothetical protein
VQVLGEADWNLSLAAARLAVPRNTLRYWMVKLEVHPRQGPAPVAARRLAELSAARLPPLTGVLVPEKLSRDAGPRWLGP